MKFGSFTDLQFLKHEILIVRLLVITCCALLLSYPAVGQSKYLSDNYWIENYTKEQGLPEDIIIDITQDRKGFMWLTTPYKLVRFDGYEFKIFNPREQFPDLYIHFYPGLIEDSEGLIWIASEEMGLFCFDPRTKKFRRFFTGDKSNPLSGDVIESLTEDDKQNIWVVTEKGLNRLSKSGDNISIKQFDVLKYPDILLKTLDNLVDHYKPLVDFSKTGNLQTRSATIEIKDTGRYFVVAEGEIVADDIPADYGWIENNKGTKIWILDDKHSLAAGGARKNKFQLDLITLTPGKYKVVYQTDDSHAWNSWNAAPPVRPDLWGIQLFALPSSLNDSIALSLKKTIEETNVYNSRIQAIFKDSKNNLWSLSNTGLDRLITSSSPSGKYLSEKITLPPDFYPGYFLNEMDSDHLLIGGFTYNPENKIIKRGIFILDRLAGTFRLFSDTLSVAYIFNPKCFFRDKRNNYWLGTFDDDGKGLFISDSGSDVPHFRHLEINPAETALLGNQGFEQIWSLYEDRSGYIWVCSRQSGLSKIKNRKMPVHYSNISIPGEKETKTTFTNIGEDAGGNIWLSAGDKGIIQYNIKNKQVRRFTGMEMDHQGANFFKAEDNAFIISDNKKTREYFPGKPVLNPFRLKVPDSLKVVAQDGYGNYWAERKKSKSSLNGFFIFDGEKFQPVHFNTDIIEFPYLRDVHFGRNGNIWISPAFGGVHQYKLDNKTKKLAFINKYLKEGIDVTDIYEDEKGLVWMGTYDDGLIRLDPDKNSYTSFTRENGLPSNQVNKLIPFGKKILIFTDLGSAFFNIKDEIILVNKEIDEYIRQNTNDFFKNDHSPPFQNLVIKTQSGEIALPAKNGFISFNPEDIQNDSIKPILQISSLSIGGKVFDMENFKEGDRTELKYNQNDLEIGYIGIHYDHSSLNHYSYFLKGANKDWVAAGTDKIARYSKLSPGYYEFYLKASNADGIWSDSQKMLAFTILSPWWERWWAYTLYAFVFGTALWSFIYYRSGQLKKENILLETKVNHRTEQLKKSLENLKSTQAQLIQSEKMASLGELTAGIAHEIQNPLNFMNNFSEVNKELIDEMKQELVVGNITEAITIANNVQQNEDKINHHGKRADAIVKGMLQHSRTGTGQKESTDLNTLADEYLRLTYHGLRAKDKSFNVSIQTDFDKNIGRINMVPQDIGRVLLNLYSNAFYALAEKKKLMGEHFEPVILVGTKKINGEVEIKVKDNGNGIPTGVLDKIFQPFFTTKPTGQGTGLGLSLSYDIVKAHGGELKVESQEGKGAEFVLHVPVV
jgi:signal transduction histidine kinase/ligand-binding sensor domain-containing protein